MTATKPTQTDPAPQMTLELPPPRTCLAILVGWAINNRYCSTGELIRDLLLSLYNGSENKVDLAGIQLLDTHQRRFFCGVLLGIGRDRVGSYKGFYDHDIRGTVIAIGGEAGLRWFLSLHNKDQGTEDLVHHFMSARRISLESEPA